jgi:hypothetical protein
MRVLFALLVVWFCLLYPNAKAEQEVSPQDAARTAAPPMEIRQDSQEGLRNFYEVLEDVLADFEYDLKNGQVTGLKDLSIRNIVMSENVPPSFKTHLELSITERILKNSKTRVIQCLPCRAKRTTLNGDQMIITSAETNPAELSRIAKISGILHFMDLAFTYHASGMIISITITDPETSGVIWTANYNSETSRASAFKRGVDYSQIDDARKMSEFQPTVQRRLTVYYLYEKDVDGYAGTLGLGFRMVERYDNRKKEVGFEIDYLKTASSLVGSTASGTTSLYTGLNLTLLFVHAWNMLPGEENFNTVRGSFYSALGGTYAAGFLGGLIRLGYEWRLAKHWAISANGGYRPPSTLFIGGAASSSVTGPEIGLGISGMF